MSEQKKDVNKAEKPKAEAPAEPKAEVKAKPQQKPAKQVEPKEKRYDERSARSASIIRLSGKDIPGNLNIENAIMNIRGIGFTMANGLRYIIDKSLNIPPETRLEDLNDEQLSKLEEVIKDPAKFGIPAFLLNRNKDMETGKDLHVVGNDLVFATRQDISRAVTLRTWIGYRHQYNLRVRGQHTRSTGRRGATVGVTKKANKPATSSSSKK
ncbi:30S ribosomal protein S13p [Candidatus Mancarchaeum acidiphilum]|uniref:30S ribosomal protein S13 n=1 Tax=Candidatus Mancarchaeum acidiphilum TaxID=1920749 RepID=A0A218NLS9_9ARCH|nr:30S ribosomal protein S13 [Candidatus Mancarchaeum acidiphilum]ASI13402.1 30S ribosomal protein S13p [Candidatus Mancarchaeum acidiphilum]